VGIVAAAAASNDRRMCRGARALGLDRRVTAITEFVILGFEKIRTVRKVGVVTAEALTLADRSVDAAGSESLLETGVASVTEPVAFKMEPHLGSPRRPVATIARTLGKRHVQHLTIEHVVVVRAVGSVARPTVRSTDGDRMHGIGVARFMAR